MKRPWIIAIPSHTSTNNTSGAHLSNYIHFYSTYWLIHVLVHWLECYIPDIGRTYTHTHTCVHACTHTKLITGLLHGVMYEKCHLCHCMRLWQLWNRWLFLSYSRQHCVRTQTASFEHVDIVQQLIQVWITYQLVVGLCYLGNKHWEWAISTSFN